MASTDARPIPLKNTAYRVTFPILDADGDLVTGATGLDSEVSKDGGAFADCTNEATEIATNSGMYFLDLTSTEMNADTVAVIVKTSSSGAKTTPMVMYPQEADDIKVSVTHWTGTAVATPDTAGYPKVTIKSGTGTGEVSLTSGTVTLTDASLTAAKFAANALTASALAADAGAEIADAVWDEAIAGHLTAGSTGEKLNSAGSAGDPWTTALPGAYGAGTAGKIVGDNLNATVSSRATQTSVDAVDDFIDTEVAAIKAKTDNLPADTATVLDTIDNFLDTEIAAIKAKTDQLTFTTANQVDATAVTVSDKTGYRLSATGVDDVLDETATSLTGKPSTLRGLIWFIRQAHSNKLSYNKLTDHMVLYEDDGLIPKLDHTMVDDIDEATRGAA